jgi:hypothetical protein
MSSGHSGGAANREAIMHLFGDSDSAHLTHFQARREAGFVELGWDVRNAPALHWRVLRSEREFAATADALPGSGQTMLMEGIDTYVMDEQIVKGTPYFYTVFAQDEQGVWHRQVKTRLAHGDRLRWLHPAHRRPLVEGTNAKQGEYKRGGVLEGDPDHGLLLLSGDPGAWGSWHFRK